MTNFRVFHDALTSPFEAMEHFFLEGGVSIVEAAFRHSYFIHPDAVKCRTPYFRDRARRSGEHYPGKDRGDKAIWSEDNREVRLEYNAAAQRAWRGYTGRNLERGSGYGVRHIWGNPWNPDCYTADWNLCYMPFWAGMLTEDQHPDKELQIAIKQASWDLYFRSNPVCDPPDFVRDPGLDLHSLLAGQPILILKRDSSVSKRRTRDFTDTIVDAAADKVETIKAIRTQRHQSWSNLRKATRALQGLDHEPFSTIRVENGAKSCVRKIQSETGLNYAEIEALLDDQGC